MTNIDQSSNSFKLVSWSIAGIALSLGVSKAGLSIFSVLLLLAFLGVWVVNRDQLPFSKISKVNKALMGLFGLGIVCSILSIGGSESLKDFANKGGLVLLVAPMSSFFLKCKWVRQRAMYALLLGGAVACSYSLYLLSQGRVEGTLGRVPSFWDVGRWAEYLCYFLVMITPLMFSADSRRHRVLLFVYYAIALIALLATGSRGPLLAVVMTTGMYFILFSRRLLIPFLILLVVLMSVVFFTTPALVEFAVTRVVSIFDFTNISNLGRLHMWMQALEFFQHNISHNLRSVLFGSGFENLGSTFEPYLEATNQREALISATSGQVSFNDHHSALLNVLNKMGLVYFSGFLFTGYVVIKALLNKLRIAPTNFWYQSAFLVLSSYLINGVFYSNEMNYQTLMAAFMCILATRFGDERVKEENQSNV